MNEEKVVCEERLKCEMWLGGYCMGTEVEVMHCKKEDVVK